MLTVAILLLLAALIFLSYLIKAPKSVVRFEPYFWLAYFLILLGAVALGMSSR